MTSKEIIKNKLADEQDSYQHYTMVDYDKTKAFWCKCEIEKLEQVLKDLDRLETLELNLDSEKYHLSNENQSLKNRVEDLEICFKVMAKENEKLKKFALYFKSDIQEGFRGDYRRGENIVYDILLNEFGKSFLNDLLKEVLKDE